MAHPGYPQPRPAKPPIATTDLTISIGALVLTVVFGVVAAAMGLFSLAFLDYCPRRAAARKGPSPLSG
jgi:hypothetical protein